MATGNLLVDASGKVLVDASGKVRLVTPGRDCCCGCPVACDQCPGGSRSAAYYLNFSDIDWLEDCVNCTAIDVNDYGSVHPFTPMAMPFPVSKLSIGLVLEVGNNCAMLGNYDSQSITVSPGDLGTPFNFSDVFYATRFESDCASAPNFPHGASRHWRILMGFFGGSVYVAGYVFVRDRNGCLPWFYGTTAIGETCNRSYTIENELDAFGLETSGSEVIPMCGDLGEGKACVIGKGGSVTITNTCDGYVEEEDI
jgi:hypothetical protein